MKRFNVFTLVITFSFLLSSTLLFTQDNDKNKVTRKKIDIENFTGIDIGSAFDIYYTTGSPVGMEIETSNKYFEKISYNVKGDVLHVNTKSIKNPKELNIYISAPYLNYIYIHGAADFSAKGVINTDKLELKASGASDVNLEVEVNTLTTNASGASSVKVSGKAGTHKLFISGASDVIAKNLETKNTYAKASGASNASVNASDVLDANSSGASSIVSIGAATGSIKESEVRNIGYVYNDEGGDTTEVKVGGLKIKVIEDDSTKVYIGNHTIIVDENGNVKYRKWRKKKFNGHWAGVELGVNGYLTKDHDMKFPKEYEYLDLKMEKSINININIWEQNFALSKNKKFGMLSGIGFSVHNYRFNSQVTLNPDLPQLEGYFDKGINVRKSKLVVNYLSIPLIFEWQSNRHCKVNSWHVSAGAIFGIRISSHTKKYFEELNTNYTWTKYDPATDSYKDAYFVTSPNQSKVKDRDDFHINPFKLAGTVRIGWGFVNLYANYSFTTLFRDGKGPELYPFEVGLSLVGW